MHRCVPGESDGKMNNYQQVAEKLIIDICNSYVLNDHTFNTYMMKAKEQLTKEDFRILNQMIATISIRWNDKDISLYTALCLFAISECSNDSTQILPLRLGDILSKGNEE